MKKSITLAAIVLSATLAGDAQNNRPVQPVPPHPHTYSLNMPSNDNHSTPPKRAKPWEKAVGYAIGALGLGLVVWTTYEQYSHDRKNGYDWFRNRKE